MNFSIDTEFIITRCNSVIKCTYLLHDDDYNNVERYASKPALLYKAAVSHGSLDSVIPLPTIIQSVPLSTIIDDGVLYCCPKLSPPASIFTPDNVNSLLYTALMFYKYS